MLKVNIFCKNEKCRPEKVGKSDLYDLKVYRITNLPPVQQTKNGWTICSRDFVVVDFGVIIQCPPGWRINLYPRSSLFAKHGLILVNSVGIIDNAYRGKGDFIKGQFYCARDFHQSELLKYERIAQIEIVKIMPSFYIRWVDKIEEESRGGLGSTGR